MSYESDQLAVQEYLARKRGTPQPAERGARRKEKKHVQIDAPPPDEENFMTYEEVRIYFFATSMI